MSVSYHNMGDFTELTQVGGTIAILATETVIAAVKTAALYTLCAISGTGSFLPSLKKITKHVHMTVTGAITGTVTAVSAAAAYCMPSLKQAGTFLPDMFNSTWVRDYFKPVNQTIAQEQAQEKAKQEVIKDIAAYCEQFWKGSGKWVSYIANAACTFFGGLVFKWSKDKFFDPTPPVTQQPAVTPVPNKRTDRAKSPGRKRR
jgi:hypothetical protein